MKKSIKIAMFALVGLFFSCQKDNNIEVIKNLDTSWKVDPEYLENDIRSRLGYDPRFNYALVENTALDFPMLSLGNLPISGQNTQEIPVKILKPLDKDLVVTLEYNSELYQAIKKDFAGFDLGKEDLIQIPEKQKTIPAGQISTSFTIVVNNNHTFKDKVILPFSFKTDEPSVKLLEGQDKVVVKIFNRELTYKYPTRIVTNVIVSASPSLYSPKFSFNVQASQQVADDIQISVRRANVSLPNLAPTGTEGDLPEAKHFRNQSSATYNFTLNSEALADAESNEIQLPLELVATIGDQSYTLPDVINVNLSVLEEAQNAEMGQQNQRKGRKITQRSGFSFEKNGSKVALWSDGSYNRHDIVGANDITLNFGEEKTITAVEISTQYWASLSGVSIYAVDNEGEEVFLGSVSGNRSPYDLIVNFKVPVRTRAIKCKSLVGLRDNIAVTEIDIYQE